MAVVPPRQDYFRSKSRRIQLRQFEVFLDVTNEGLWTLLVVDESAVAKCLRCGYVAAAVAVPDVSFWESAEIATLFPNAKVTIDRTTVPAFIGSGSALEKMEGAGQWERIHLGEFDTAAESCLESSVQPAFHDDWHPTRLPIIGRTVRQVDNDT